MRGHQGFDAQAPRPAERPRALQPRHHVHRLLRPQCHRSSSSLRRHPASSYPRTIGSTSNGGACSASPRSIASCTTSTTISTFSTTASCRRSSCSTDTATTVRRCVGLRAPTHGTYVADVRHRFGARRTRVSFAYSKTMHVRRPACLVCSREPPPHDARVSRTLTNNVGLRPVSDYGMHLQAALAEIAPPGCRQPDDSPDVARGLQLGVLRARLSRARDGRAARRGARPGRGGRRGLHEDHRRAFGGWM